MTTAQQPRLDTAYSGWSKAISVRRQHLLNRVAAGGVSAIVFAPIIGTGVALAWLGAYMVSLLLERIAVRPERGQNGHAPTGLSGILSDAIIFTSATVFAWIAFPLWFLGGAFGGLCAIACLGASLLQSVSSGAGSKRVTYVTVAPTALIALTTPWLMIQLNAPTAHIIAASTALIVFLAIAVSTAHRLFESNQAQHKAMVMAETKRLQAEQAMESRTAFLSMIAHDLRTPITAILTGADTLRQDIKPEQQPHPVGQKLGHRLAMIEDAGLMMNALLNDLLDQARIEAGCMSINKHPFDLRRMMGQTIRLWAPVIKRKGLQLHLDIEKGMPRLVYGDEIRLRQVLNNIVSNAVKFTDKGSITLRAYSWLDDQSNYALTFELVDTGYGMTPTQVERLFNRFDQTSDDIGSRFGGSGLGLSVSHDLVRLMDGRLTARSVAGAGTNFTVAITLPPADEDEVALNPQVSDEAILPYRLAISTLDAAPQFTLREEPAAAPVTPAPVTAYAETVQETTPEDTYEALFEPEAEAEGPDTPLRVLVVDDHEINRRAIQLILQSFDCDITMAADGMSALELARTNVFDVIFMDVRMPELDGRETTRRLRIGGGPNVNTPVIAVTADSSLDDQSACRAAGMDAFVAKPLTPSSLIGALQSTLEAHQARAAA